MGPRRSRPSSCVSVNVSPGAALPAWHIPLLILLDSATVLARHPSPREFAMTVMSPAMTVLYPARKAARAMTAEDLWAIPRVGAPVAAPDGTWLAVAVTTYDLEKNEGRGRIWRVNARDGEATPLTALETSSAEP